MTTRQSRFAGLKNLRTATETPAPPETAVALSQPATALVPPSLEVVTSPETRASPETAVASDSTTLTAPPAAQTTTAVALAPAPPPVKETASVAPRTTATPRRSTLRRPPTRRSRALATEEKLPATFYLPQSLVDELEELWQRARREVAPRERGPINKSLVVELVLRAALDDAQLRPTLKSSVRSYLDSLIPETT